MRIWATVTLLVVVGCSQERPVQQRLWDQENQDGRCAEPVTPFQPKNGVISTDQIAKDVAYRYLREIYPEDRDMQPLTVTLRHGVWTADGYMPAMAAGGAAHIELCQSNGRVLTIYHEQ